MFKKEIKKDKSELLITIEADKTSWEQAQKSALENLSKNLSVKGFRKGNVPASIAKKNISQEDIFAEGLKNIINSLAKKAAEQIKDEWVLDGPTYAVNKLSTSQLEVNFTYPLYPEIKISDYKKLGINFKEEKHNEEEVQKEIANLQEKQAILVEKQGPLKNGDTAKFDFEGKVDGQVFKGGSAKDFELEIGSKRFIPGFEEQMIGLKKGDKKDLKVTFPKEYHESSLKNKEAIFSVTIKEVKQKEKPKLDDDFAKELNIKNVKNLAQLKTYLKNQLIEQKRQVARSKFRNLAFEKIAKDTNIVIPNSLVFKEAANIKKQFETSISQQGLDLKKYLEITKTKEEQLQQQWRNQALKRLKESFLFAEIARLEKIVIKPEDYEKEYVKLAKVYQQDEKKIREMIKKEQMQIPMTNDRVIDKLIEYHK